MRTSVKRLALFTLALCLLVSLAGCKSEAAKSADALITAIGEVTLDSEDAITAAEEAVAALSESDLKHISGLETLESARAQYDQLVLEDKAAQVDAAIDAIGEVTLDSEEAIAAAEQTVADTPDDVLALVQNVGALEDARAQYDQLVLEDKAAQVDAVIDAIGEVTLDSEEAIAAAEQTVADTPDDVLALVQNVGALEEARAQYDQLVLEDKAAQVDAAIDAIGEVTLDSEEAIAAAEQTVADTPDDVLALVQNVGALEDARAQYDLLVLEDKAAQVDAAIAAIGEVTLDSEEAIAAAEQTVADTPEDVLALVQNVGALEDARAQYDQLVLADKAAQVDAAIAAIGEVTLDSADAIDAAQQAYNAAPADVQALVTGQDTLDTAVQQLSDLKTAEIDSLLGKMQCEEDKVRSLNFYYPSGWSFYSNGSWVADSTTFIRPYLGVQKNYAWIRMVCNYTAWDWLFFDHIIFSIDGTNHTKSFSYFDVVRDNGGGRIWEYVDFDVSGKDIDMLWDIANSTETIVRFEGDDYYDDHTVTDSEKQAIRDVLTAYELING